MSAHDELEGLAAGYALHALEPEEEQRLASHVMTCPDCARLVADAATVGAAIAGALPPEEPPPGLRARILAAAAAEARTPAESAGAVAPSTPPRTPVSDRIRQPSRSGSARRWQLRGRLAVGVLAAAVGIAVAVPVTLAVSENKHPTQNSALADWLLSPNAHEVTLSAPSPASHAKAVVSDRGIYLVADGLPRNDRAHNIYVLWAANKDGGRAAVATFDVSGGAPVQVTATKLPYKEADIKAVMVSFEPGRKAPVNPSKVVLSGSAA